MADLTITPGNIVPVAGSSGADSPYTGTAGEDLTQFQPVYKATDGLYYRARATSETLAYAEALTVNSAKTGQPISMMSGGKITVGSILTQGEQYVVSANLGKVAPKSDLVSTNLITYLCIAESATVARLAITPHGIQVP